MEANSKRMNDLSSLTPSNGELHRLSEEQLLHSSEVIEEDPEYDLELVAGVDVSYNCNLAYSCAVVVNEELELVESSYAQTRVSFPYVSGYLSYRESKPAMAAVKKLSYYDILMVNGHGIAHPRGYGLASQMGVQLRKPTIGVARRPMIGQPQDPQAEETPIIYKGRKVGAKINSPHGAPVYVSVGHMITLDTSIRLVKDYTLEGRLPEPLKLAHSFSKTIMSEY